MPHQERSIHSQTTALAAAVVLLHIGGLYALQYGLLGRTVPINLPVLMLSDFVEAPQPVMQPAPQQPKNVPLPGTQTAPKISTPARSVQPLATQDAAPNPAAPSAMANPTSIAPSNEAALSAPAVSNPSPVALALPVSTKLELPSSEADYLNNPPPAYPAVSRRLGEAGKVVVRVYISTDGIAQKAEIRSSSGFERLDTSALTAALKWRYVPGKRGGTAEAMWVNVPVAFTLN